MKKRYLLHTNQALVLMILAFIGMIFSAEFLVAQAMIWLVVIGVFQWDSTRIKIVVRAGLLSSLNYWRKSPIWWAVSVPFLLVLVSAMYVTDLSYTLSRLRIKSPFLLLPLAFLMLPRLSNRQLKVLLFAFLSIVFLACMGTLIHYFAHYESINQSMLQGKPIPTPSNHIRFSLSIVLAIVAGGILLFWQMLALSRYAKLLAALMTSGLFVGIHILSVRSGLLTLYLILLVSLCRYLVSTRSWKIGIAGLAAVVMLPILAFTLIPSLQNKIGYMRYDLEQYFAGNTDHLSDSERLLSLEVGLKIGKAHPWWGVGAGDLKQEMKRVYKIDYPDIRNFKMPHNQLITVFAGTGLVGLFAFLLAYCTPLFYRKARQCLPLLLVLLIFFVSFLMENTFENNFGISLYLFWLLPILHYLFPPVSTPQRLFSSEETPPKQTL